MAAPVSVAVRVRSTAILAFSKAGAELLFWAVGVCSASHLALVRDVADLVAVAVVVTAAARLALPEDIIADLSFETFRVGPAGRRIAAALEQGDGG